jgi:hypothetical protein
MSSTERSMEQEHRVGFPAKCLLLLVDADVKVV